jgi:hypothetical protein
MCILPRNHHFTMPLWIWLPYVPHKTESYNICPLVTSLIYSVCFKKSYCVCQNSLLFYSQIFCTEIISFLFIFLIWQMILYIFNVYKIFQVHIHCEIANSITDSLSITKTQYFFSLQQATDKGGGNLSLCIQNNK